MRLGGHKPVREREKACLLYFLLVQSHRKASRQYKNGALCVCVFEKSPPKVKGVEKERQRYRTLTFIHYLEERLGRDQVSDFQLCSRVFIFSQAALSQPALR